MILTNDPDLVASEARNLYSSGWAVRASPHGIQDSDRTVSAGWGMYTDDSFESASIEKKIADSLGISVVVKHKRVQKATRNAAVLTLDYKSSFHKSARSKDGKEKELPFVDHYLCRPNDKARVQEFLQKQFK